MNKRSVSPASARPVTVADLIGMTTIGSFTRSYGNADYNIVAPDGSRLATVVQRGNLERNTVDFTLLVFRTADVWRGPKPDTVAAFSSSSNRPGIAFVRWLADSRTLAFLAERPGELPQVYTLDTRTRQLAQRTHATTEITVFDVAARGEPVVYAAEERGDTLTYPSMRAHGFVLSRHALVSDVIAGDWGLDGPAWRFQAPRTLHVAYMGHETIVPLPDSTAGYSECSLDEATPPSVDPNGGVVIVQCGLRTMSPAWRRYRQWPFSVLADFGEAARVYVVVELTTGRASRLINAPVDHGATLVWAPDGRSVVLGNAILPLDSTDSTEQAWRATHHVLAEVDVQTGAVTVVAHRDSLVALAWDARSATVVLGIGRFLTANDARRVYYRKATQGWRAISTNAVSAASIFVIDEGLNTPPTLAAVDSRTERRHVIYDPNPGLLVTHRFAREEIIHWRTKAGATWTGGLYWPPDYVRGRRYPLVAQTHGFDSAAFAPYGVYSTGEAAQPIANKGVMVLQMPDPPDSVFLTLREAPAFVEGAEGAIDYLDSLGLIDRTRVGMQGFSRSCYYTLSFLTQSRYPIAAATLTDGVDLSYVQHMMFGLSEDANGLSEDAKLNGGEPFGASLRTWMDRAPGFNLDRITTPLQLVAIQPGSLLGEWEPYSGLLLQGKPAELLYIPNGSHILTKSWERRTSQQGAVDWYLFWLKGESDSDPAKAEQYARWRRLRAMQDSSASVPSAQHR